MQNGLRIVLAAGICGFLGIIFYHSQDAAAPLMSLWGIVSFTAVGASIGCLTAKEDQGAPPDFWGLWW